MNFRIFLAINAEAVTDGIALVWLATEAKHGYLLILVATMVRENVNASHYRVIVCKNISYSRHRLRTESDIQR